MPGSLRSISVDGATLWHAGGEAIDLVTELLPTQGSLDDSTRLEIDYHWSLACQKNPKLFDGPILSVAGFDPRAGRLSLEERRYRDFAAQGTLEVGVTLLAVNGLVLKGDPAAPLERQQVLVGRRSRQVHTHPGRLEPAPAGGVDPLGDGRSPTLGDLRAQLAVEAREEIGAWPALEEAIASALPLGIVFDHQARSCDVVLEVRLDEAAPMPSGWEYEAIEWLALDAFMKLAATRPYELIPPAVALAGLLRSRSQRSDRGHAADQQDETGRTHRGPDAGHLRLRGAS